MMRMILRKKIFGIVFLFLPLLTPTASWAAKEASSMAKRVGDRAPIFSVATSLGTLADYDRDYYGKHHLVLTFVPAAFTPV